MNPLRRFILAGSTLCVVGLISGCATNGMIKWTHLSRQISSGFKLNPLLLLQPNGAAPMRPGWKDFRPGQSD